MVSLCRLEPADEAATAAVLLHTVMMSLLLFLMLLLRQTMLLSELLFLVLLLLLLRLLLLLFQFFLALKYSLFVSRCFPFHPRECKLLSLTLASIQKGHGSGSSSFPLFRCLSREFSSRTF